MGKERTSVARRVAEWLGERRPGRITESLWEELCRALAPVPEERLRRLLRDSGLPLDPLVEGVRQDSFESLERTLLALQGEYQRAVAAADQARVQACRRLVMAAKDRARWVTRNPHVAPEKKAQKEEMLLWMMTWLENPAVFDSWLRLRKRATGTSPPSKEGLAGAET